MRLQRISSGGTLAVICLATAMLMLDIAVVNTALPGIARDLDTGLSGDAVGGRRLHPRPRRGRPHRGSLADRSGGAGSSASASPLHRTSLRARAPPITMLDALGRRRASEPR